MLAEGAELTSPSQKSNRPSDDPFMQQTMMAWQPILTPIKIIVIFLAMGISFVPTGTYLMQTSNNIFEKRIQYDGSGSDVECKIKETNEGRICSVTFKIDEDIDGPLYLYYELSNFYQNHRIYVASLSPLQLQGEYQDDSELEAYCNTKRKNHSLILNPCGLIANSYFNDVFTVQNYTTTKAKDVSLNTNNIAWQSDRDYKFKQPNGFKKQIVPFKNATCSEYGLDDTCKYYYDEKDGEHYLYYYPRDSQTQYLYESYPTEISPIEGVEDEHFIVWMRTASLSKFRKLYGKFNNDFSKGDTITMEIKANFDVHDYHGKKALLVSTLSDFGGKNVFLGMSYVVVGSICLFFGVLFAVKHFVAPRETADASMLKW